MSDNKVIGELGERIAINYISELKYDVLEKNFRCRNGEIDIIAKDKEIIVFIEVKTRRSLNYGRPAEAVNSSKVKHLVSVAQYYLYRKHLKNCCIRFDVIEVFLIDGKCTLNHLKNVVCL